jgi:hypothetical protein
MVDFFHPISITSSSKIRKLRYYKKEPVAIVLQEIHIRYNHPGRMGLRMLVAPKLTDTRHIQVKVAIDASVAVIVIVTAKPIFRTLKTE